MKKLFIVLVLIPLIEQIKLHASQGEISRRLKTDNSAVADDLIALFSEMTSGYISRHVQQALESSLQDPKCIIFLLAQAHKNNKDMQTILALKTAAKAHLKLCNFLENHESISLSIGQREVIRNCAVIAQKLRHHQAAGTVIGKNPSLLNNISGETTELNGQDYYNNACPCQLYDILPEDLLNKIIEASKQKEV